MNIGAFGYWLIAFLGLLWVKRATYGKLRCNVFSAAITAGLFVFITYKIYFLLFTIPFYEQEGVTKYALFLLVLFLGLGLIPLATMASLFLGKVLVPFFRIGSVSDFVICTLYLSGWIWIALMLASILQIIGYLLMFLFLGGGGMPRVITKVSNDEYHYY